jgi:hypothetical protein
MIKKANFEGEFIKKYSIIPVLLSITEILRAKNAAMFS